MRKIKVAIIGVGTIANGAHMPAWKRIPQAEVVAICDTIDTQEVSFAKKWGVPHTYNSFSDLLEKEPVDLIDMCTPPSIHLAQITQALEAKKHVIVEKPLVLAIEDSEKILSTFRAVEEEGVKLGVIHNFLFDPVFQKALVLTKRKLGEVLSVKIEFHVAPNDGMIKDKIIGLILCLEVNFVKD